MGFRNVAWVLDHSPYKGTQRLIHVIIADCANDEGGICWPSQAFIARRAACTVETVRSTVKQMINDGHLALMSPSTVNGKSHTYRLKTSPNLKGRVPKSEGEGPQIRKQTSPNPSPSNQKEPDKEPQEFFRCIYCKDKLRVDSPHHYCSAMNMRI
jgi:hypothetical protein